MAIKVNGLDVIDNNRRARFRGTNVGRFTTTERDNLSGETGDVIFNTTDEELQTWNGTEWKSVGSSGNTVSSSEPTDKDIGDLWTDTSVDPTLPLLKVWTGSEWVAIASGTGSGEQPVIESIALSDASLSADRFTNETFNVDYTMVNDGVPESNKLVKGKVTATFEQRYEFEPVASNTASVWPANGNGVTTTKYSTSNYDTFGPFPINDTGYQGWGWVYGSSSYYYFVKSTEITADPGDLTPESVNGTNSGQAWYAEYLKWFERVGPTDDDPNIYYWMTPRANYGANRTCILYYNVPNSTWNMKYNSTSYPTNVVYDQASKEYYWCNASQLRIYRNKHHPGSPLYDNNNSTYCNVYGSTYSDRGCRVAICNGYVYVNLQDDGSSNYRPYYYYAPLGFNNNSNAQYGTYWINSNYEPDKPFTHNGYVYQSAGSRLWVTNDIPSGNWTEITPVFDGFSSEIRGIDADPNTGAVRILLSNYQNDTQFKLYTTNNFGANWVEYFDSGELPLPSYFDGSSNTYYPDPMSFVFGNGYFSVLYDKGYNVNYFTAVWAKTNNQSIQLEGEGADYDQFYPGYQVRLKDNEDYRYNGTLVSKSAGQLVVDSEYTFQNGDVIQAVAPNDTGLATKYLQIQPTGLVTSLLTDDPGYVDIGPGLNKDITFASVFPSGNTPDTELPVGTVLQVDGKAQNDTGSSTASSNQLTL